jgi:hypothetical protein
MGIGMLEVVLCVGWFFEVGEGDGWMGWVSSLNTNHCFSLLGIAV